MKNLGYLTILLITATLLFTACDDTGDTDEPPPSKDSSDNLDVGGTEEIQAGSKTIQMIYANDQHSITFPFSPAFATPSDDTKATLTREFYMSTNLVTNALMAEVLQWAYDNDKFSTNVADHNGIDTTTAKHGGKQLLDFDDANLKIGYAEGDFTVETGYENHPAVCVTWYGTVIFCNWLTEMVNGDTAQVVYTGITDEWDHNDTVENADRTGFRLPSNEEWEYAARYVGTSKPTEGDLAAEYIAANHNDGHEELTDGYYWTPASYASGATSDCTNEEATRAVAWYWRDPDFDGMSEPMPVGQKRPNQLGLYDMSGNVREWCFTAADDNRRRVERSCGYNDDENLEAGYWHSSYPHEEVGYLGFRIAMTGSQENGKE